MGDWTKTIESVEAGIGHNNPPEPTPFEAHSANLDDLDTEARAWLDGSKIENQAQADIVTAMLDAAKKAGKAVDDARTEEKAPHLAAGRAVDAKWKPLAAKAEKIEKATKATLAMWLRAEQARMRAEAEAIAAQARVAEDKARRDRQEAARSGNMVLMDAAEDALSDAAQLQKDAERADKAKPAAKVEGMTRAATLRTVWTPHIADAAEAMRTYWRKPAQRARIEELLWTMAREDVRAGARQIAGFDIRETQEL